VLEAMEFTTPIQSAFTTWELLVGAAFSGFEGALIAIALFGLIKTPIIALAISMVMLSVLIFSQTQHWLKQSQLLIIMSVSLAIIFFFPYLRNSYDSKRS
jgi:serine/threonine-protein kinase